MDIALNIAVSIATISATDVAIGDYNGDKQLDLAFLNHNSQEESIFLYWGTGRREFNEQKRQVLNSQDLQTGERPKGWLGDTTGNENPSHNPSQPG